MDFRRDILPKLQRLPVRVIAEAMDASISHGSKVRGGKLVPHRRHWKALKGLKPDRAAPRELKRLTQSIVRLEMANDLVPRVGQLDICNLCDSSPHAVGCPRHSMYADDRWSYERVDALDEAGPASFWVEETYAVAAMEAGLASSEAVLERMREFGIALQRGELRRTSFQKRR